MQRERVGVAVWMPTDGSGLPPRVLKRCRIHASLSYPRSSTGSIYLGAIKRLFTAIYLHCEARYLLLLPICLPHPPALILKHIEVCPGPRSFVGVEMDISTLTALSDVESLKVD